MAEVTQIIAPAVDRTVPFSGRPPGVDENNIYPRARVIFENTTEITAKGAGDTKAVTLNLDLPANFYYVVDSFYVGIGDIANNDSDNYETSALQTYNIEAQANGDIFTSVVGVLAQLDAGGQIMCFRRRDPAFSEIFGNQMGISTRLSTVFNDSDGVNASAAMDCFTYATFLQYDVRQADMVRVNAPMPVRVQ